MLVESYLYTREMVAEALDHLAPGGVLCMQFGEVDYDRKPRRTARYLATARSVLAERGALVAADERPQVEPRGGREEVHVGGLQGVDGRAQR